MVTGSFQPQDRFARAELRHWCMVVALRRRRSALYQMGGTGGGSSCVGCVGLVGPVGCVGLVIAKSGTGEGCGGPSPPGARPGKNRAELSQSSYQIQVCLSVALLSVILVCESRTCFIGPIFLPICHRRRYQMVTSPVTYRAECNAVPEPARRTPDLIRPPIVGERYKAYIQVSGEMGRRLREVQAEMQEQVGPWRKVGVTHVIRHLLQLGLDAHAKLEAAGRAGRRGKQGTGGDWRSVYKGPPHYHTK